VALDRFRDDELVGTIDAYGKEHVHPAVLERLHELAGLKRYVARVGAVAIDDCGDLAGAPGATGATLAELGTRLGG
jgi:isoaspartyl peptidase/L-asparaginase-like protein (Ntn-hydrolase superfamily)